MNKKNKKSKTIKKDARTRIISKQYGNLRASKIILAKRETEIAHILKIALVSGNPE